MVTTNSNPIKEYLAKKDEKDEEEKKAREINRRTARLPEPKGIFKKRCPFCNTKIKKQQMGWSYFYYKCSKCDYEKSYTFWW